MEHDKDFDTTVLTDDYGDFRDTVVDQVVAFDPSLFQGPSGERVQQAQRPTWVSAGLGTVVDGVTESARSDQQRHRSTRGQSQPRWTNGQGEVPRSAASRLGDEDTWVLGSSQFGQSVTYVPAPGSTAAASRSPQASTAKHVPQQALGATTWRPVPQTTPTMMAAADSKPSRINPVFFGAIVALALIGVAAIVVAAVFALGLLDGYKQAPEKETVAVVPESAAASDSKEAVKAESEPEKDSVVEQPKETSAKPGSGDPTVVQQRASRAISEDAAYEKLSEFYRQASEYDSRIASCADDFNDNYMKEDKSIRGAKAATASSLNAKVKSSWEELKNLEISLLSKNLHAYDDLCVLYECLWNRIDVIDRAWKISLKFEKPATHQDEILDPIRADNVGGANKYYTRFKELYPQVSIVKP